MKYRLALLFFILAASCTRIDERSLGNVNKEPAEFEIHYSVNTGPVNLVDFDTRKGTYSVSRCNPEQRQEFKIALSRAQKDRIVEQVKAQDFMKIVHDFDQDCDSKIYPCLYVSPEEDEVLTVILGKKANSIKWSNRYSNQHDPKLQKFQKVTEAINGVLKELETGLEIKGTPCELE